MNRKKFVYQFSVSLKGIEPRIWRRIEVPVSYSFWDLHVAIQDAMGWLDCHLHMFRIRNPESGKIDEIGIPSREGVVGDRVCLPGWQVPISAYFRNPGDRSSYEYDFGDSWKHEVVLERIVERIPKVKYPKCLDGARACPPEDCGGVWGYRRLLETIGDPSHTEYESTMEWLGGSYDPEAFDPQKVRFDSSNKRWKIAFGNE